MAFEAQSILVLLHDLALGGSERIAIRLANRWAEEGRKVTLFCGAREGALAHLPNPGVTIVECAPVIRRGPGSRAKLGRSLCDFLAEHDFDLIFVPGNYQWPALLQLRGRAAKRRPTIVTHVSTPLVRRGRKGLAQWVYSWITRQRLRCVDAAIALSPKTVDHADKILGRRITIDLPLPVLDQPQTHHELAPAAGKTILAAGRLVREKGFDCAIRALALMQDRTAKLVILGEGPLRRELEDLAQRLGVAGRVSMPGYVADIRPWLNRARLFALSSHYEGFGAVIVEALGAGRPVLSTNCTPAVDDILKPLPSCHIVPVDDAAAMAVHLDQMLREPVPDPRSLAAAVAAYNLDHVAKRHLTFFDNVHVRRLLTADQAPHFMPHIEQQRFSREPELLGVN